MLTQMCHRATSFDLGRVLKERKGLGGRSLLRQARSKTVNKRTRIKIRTRYSPQHSIDTENSDTMQGETIPCAFDGKPTRAKVIAICGVDTECVLSATSLLHWSNEFKHHIEAGSVEFRIACADKYSASIPLSESSWPPKILTSHPDEALKEADLVILAANSLAMLRSNILSFQTVQETIASYASPGVKVVSCGLPRQQEWAFQIVFPSWNVGRSIHEWDVAGMSSIVNSLFAYGMDAQVAGGDDMLELGGLEEITGNVLDFELDNSPIGPGNEDIANPAYFLAPVELEMFLGPPSLLSDEDWPSAESSPSSTLQSTTEVQENFLLPISLAAEESTSPEPLPSTRLREAMPSHQSNALLSENPKDIAGNWNNDPVLTKIQIASVRGELCDPHQNVNEITDFIPTHLPHDSSQSQPLDTKPDLSQIAVHDVHEERKETERKAKQRDRKKAQRAEIKARADAGEAKAKAMLADNKEKQRRAICRRRLRMRLGKSGHGSEVNWLEPLYDACVALAPAFGQNVHSLFMKFCARLSELRSGDFDTELYSRYCEENRRRHIECKRDSQASMLKAFDTLLTLAGDEAMDVQDRIKEVSKVTGKKFAKQRQSPTNRK